jgi:1-acyl-sn-glycerol-3-phosphate acyltransferase
VPVDRQPHAGDDVLAPAKQALEAGDIVIIFPEGTRGPATDDLAPMKAGVARLAAAFPQAPVIPIWIEGAGRVLPKGAVFPAPMNCTVLVGEPMAWGGERSAFMDTLRERLEALRKTAPPQRWLSPDPPDRPPTSDEAASSEP